MIEHGYTLETFKAGALTLPYFHHTYNLTRVNERRCEVPLGAWFLRQHTRVVEVGAVMPYYHPRAHEVIDPYDPHPACTRLDAEAYDYIGMNVLSISTMEHLGGGEYGDPLDPAKPIRCLDRIRSTARAWLITFPIGVNRTLEAALDPCLTLARDEHNNWSVTHEPWSTFAYASPYPLGNAIAIITNISELQP